LEKGDISEKHLTGGGGFGNPLERPIERVREDMINEFLLVQKAREDYGVVIDPATLKVDYEETEKVRGEQG